MRFLEFEMFLTPNNRQLNKYDLVTNHVLKNQGTHLLGDISPVPFAGRGLCTLDGIVEGLQRCNILNKQHGLKVVFGYAFRFHKREMLGESRNAIRAAYFLAVLDISRVGQSHGMCN